MHRQQRFDRRPVGVVDEERPIQPRADLAQLVAARPVSMTDAATPSSWRCDYRNTSPSSTIEIVAEVYCIHPSGQ